MTFITDEAYHAGDMSERRPAGISVLAILYSLTAAWSFIAVIGFLFAPGVTARVLNSLYHTANLVDFGSYEIGDRLFFTCLDIAGVALVYFLACGLWRLRNWARVIVIVFLYVDLISCGWPTELLPYWQALQAGPAFMLLNEILIFAVLLYLVSPHVAAAFGVPAQGRKWQYIACVYALCVFAFLVRKSKPELDAIRWHRQHGNEVAINGVTFPVYRWYAPGIFWNGKLLDISDKPGPLRHDDSLSVIEIYGCKDVEKNKNLTVEQLVDSQIQSEERSGYKDSIRFPLNVGKQTMSCTQQRKDGGRVDCYGDGPIYSTFFVGDDRALRRFKSMMAEAR